MVKFCRMGTGTGMEVSLSANLRTPSVRKAGCSEYNSHQSAVFCSKISFSLIQNYYQFLSLFSPYILSKQCNIVILGFASLITETVHTKVGPFYALTLQQVHNYNKIFLYYDDFFFTPINMQFSLCRATNRHHFANFYIFFKRVKQMSKDLRPFH